MFLEEDHSRLCGGLDLVTELVIPCVPQLVSSRFIEDREAVEEMRNKWFTLLGGNTLDSK